MSRTAACRITRWRSRSASASSTERRSADALLNHQFSQRFGIGDDRLAARRRRIVKAGGRIGLEPRAQSFGTARIEGDRRARALDCPGAEACVAELRVERTQDVADDRFAAAAGDFDVVDSWVARRAGARVDDARQALQL